MRGWLPWLTLPFLLIPAGWCPCAFWHHDDADEQVHSASAEVVSAGCHCHCQACPRGETAPKPITPKVGPSPTERLVIAAMAPVSVGVTSLITAGDGDWREPPPGPGRAPISILHCRLTI